MGGVNSVEFEITTSVFPIKLFSSTFNGVFTYA